MLDIWDVSLVHIQVASESFVSFEPRRCDHSPRRNGMSNGRSVRTVSSARTASGLGRARSRRMTATFCNRETVSKEALSVPAGAQGRSTPYVPPAFGSALCALGSLEEYPVRLTTCHSAAAQGASGYTERPPRPKIVNSGGRTTTSSARRTPTRSLPAAMACSAAWARLSDDRFP